MRKRRLSDLYVRGKEIQIDDNTGDPVTVWLQKLNEVDRESVLRRAHAAKARFLIDADNEESDAFHAQYDKAREFGERAGLISLIVANDVAKARVRIEAQLATNEDTWGKDNYLQGLVDAWLGDDHNPGLVHTAEEDPDDPEATRVKAEINRYEAEVAEAVKAEVAAHEADWEQRTDDQCWRAAAHKLVERDGENAFSLAYQRQVLFYSVREPKDHTQRYLGTVAEVDDLDDQIRAHIIEQFNALMVPPAEGKDLRASPDSSLSSASPEETPESSGLEAATA